jgi:hypothetical protein
MVHKCRVCNITCATAAGLASHLRSNPGGTCALHLSKRAQLFRDQRKRPANHPDGDSSNSNDSSRKQRGPASPAAQDSLGAQVEDQQVQASEGGSVVDSLEQPQPPLGPEGSPSVSNSEGPHQHVSVAQAEADARSGLERLLVSCLSEQHLSDMFAIFNSAPGFRYRPADSSSSALVQRLLSGSATTQWSETNITLQMECEPFDAHPQYVLVRADLQAAIQELLLRHPAVLNPSKVYAAAAAGLQQERIFSEFYTADQHIDTQLAWESTDSQPFGSIMLKLWSDVTTAGGNDRLPLRVALASLGNHPLAFSKSSQGQIMLAIMNEIFRGAGKCMSYCCIAGLFGGWRVKAGSMRLHVSDMIELPPLP